MSQRAHTTKVILHNFLTTTPSSSHIIDYRKQRRTDSRADKPDVFPGFDFHEDSTTPSARKRRRQAYSQLIRLFIQNTRDRLDTIRDVIKDESELHFHMTKPSGEIHKNINGPAHFLNENDDSANRQLIDLAFTDASINDEKSANIAQFSNRNMENASRAYLNSLFAAIGYSRVHTTSTPSEIDDGNIITRYVLSPIFRLWFKTQKNFKLQSGAYNENDTHGNSATDFDVNFANDDDNGDTHSNDESETNRKTSYSLPFMIQSLNNETNVFVNNSDGYGSKFIDALNQNENESFIYNDNEIYSVEEIASTAFQKAFYEETSDMDQMKQNHNNISNAPAQSAQLKRFDKNENNELMSKDLLFGRLFDGNSYNIQVVPSKKLKLDQISSEDGDFKRVAGIESNKRGFGENAGILVLEILGTVVGSAWKALSQIPNYLMGQK